MFWFSVPLLLDRPDPPNDKKKQQKQNGVRRKWDFFETKRVKTFGDSEKIFEFQISSSSGCLSCVKEGFEASNVREPGEIVNCSQLEPADQRLVKIAAHQSELRRARIRKNSFTRKSDRYWHWAPWERDRFYLWIIIVFRNTHSFHHIFHSPFISFFRFSPTHSGGLRLSFEEATPWAEAEKLKRFTGNLTTKWNVSWRSLALFLFFFSVVFNVLHL